MSTVKALIGQAVDSLADELEQLSHVIGSSGAWREWDMAFRAIILADPSLVAKARLKFAAAR